MWILEWVFISILAVFFWELALRSWLLPIIKERLPK